MAVEGNLRERGGTAVVGLDKLRALPKIAEVHGSLYVVEVRFCPVGGRKGFELVVVLARRVRGRIGPIEDEVAVDRGAGDRGELGRHKNRGERLRSPHGPEPKFQRLSFDALAGEMQNAGNGTLIGRRTGQ